MIILKLIVLILNVLGPDFVSRIKILLIRIIIIVQLQSLESVIIHILQNQMMIQVEEEIREKETKEKTKKRRIIEKIEETKIIEIIEFS